MIIRITNHPQHDNILTIHTPPQLANTMGQLAAARWSPPDNAYLLAATDLPGLEALARHASATLIDQRTTGRPARPVPQECRHCGQPGTWANPPAHCPDCGKPWDPVPPPGHGATGHTHTRCPQCGKHQRGRFPHCGSCGAPLDHGPATTRPLIPAIPRAHLDDPLPLADVLSDNAPHPQDQA